MTAEPTEHGPAGPRPSSRRGSAPTMQAWVVGVDGLEQDRELVRASNLAAQQTPFWLDIEAPTDEVIDRLANLLDLHPLAVEDAKTFGQQGAMEVYGDVTVLVGFGLDTGRMEPIEVHAFLGDAFLVTLHRSPSAALERARADPSVQALLGGDRSHLLHAVASALHRDFPSCIDVLDSRLGELGREVLRDPDDQHLIEIGELNQIAGNLRRTVSPGRGLANRLETVDRFGKDSGDSRAYVTDISDDLHQITSDLEALEDRCLAMLGLHASLASNRLSAASRQLTIVATIFLPITFLVGFFGQNFAVLIDPIQQGWISFIVLGVSLNVLCMAATIALLRKRGLQ